MAKRNSVESNPFEMIADLAGLSTAFLRRYATVTMVTQALVRWPAAIDLFVLWTSEKGVDSKMVLRLYESLPPRDRVRVVHMSGLCNARPSDFARIANMLIRDMLALSPKVPLAYVEALSRMLILFAERHPYCISRIEAGRFQALGQRYLSGSSAKRVNTICAFLMLQLDLEANVRRIVRLAPSSPAFERVVHTLTLKVPGRSNILCAIRKHAKGKLLLDEVEAVRRTAATEWGKTNG